MPHFSPETGLNWGAPLPGNFQRKLLTTRGSLKGFCYQRWGGDGVEWGGGLVFQYCSWAGPPTCHMSMPGPIWAPYFPAGHAVSVYKDLGMMSPFLPDLQLFSLMLCCLGGPLWGGDLPCAPPPCRSAPPRPLLFHVVNTPGPWWDGVQARETTGGWGWGWG